MSKKIQKTLTTNHLIVSQYLKQQYPILPNSTVNENLEILEDAELNDLEYPGMACIVIGIKGHLIDTQSNVGSFPSSRRHKPTDTALREHIPFVARLLDDDLNEEQRKNYALRKVETVKGEPTALYYAKRIDLSNINIQNKQIKMRDGKLESEVDFNFDSSNLHPTIPDVSVDLNDALLNGDAVRSSGLTKVVLNAFDLTELINVFKVLYDSDDGALISEWGYCTGVDRLVTVPGAQGEDITFNEIAACQVGTFVAQFNKIESEEDIIDLSMDFGSRATRPTISS